MGVASTSSGARIFFLGSAVVAVLLSSASIVKTAPAATPAEQAGPESWSMFGDIPRMLYPSAAELDGKLYVAGGYLYTSGEPFTVAPTRSYDPATGTWATLAPLSRAFTNLAAVNGKLYAVGGYNLIDSGCGGAPVVEEYDPGANTWIDKASFPGGECEAVLSTAVAVGTKIFQFGGRNGNTGVISAEVYEYDTSTDIWTPRPDLSMPRPLYHATAATVNGHVFIFGGVSETSGSGGLNSAVLDLDLALGTWTVHEHPFHLRRSGSGVAVRDGLIYLIGGGPDGTAQTSVAIYDPALDSFTEGPGLIAPRTGPAAAAVGRDIYAVGGNSPWDPSTTAEVLGRERPPCLPGGYLASPADDYCSWAPAGSFVSDSGATSATLCAPGTYSATPGATSCTAAPLGMVVTTSGATQPTACPVGYHASADATACLLTIRWSPMATPLDHQIGPGQFGSFTTELGGRLYVMGGTDYHGDATGLSGVTTGGVRSYDPLTGTWVSLAQMHHPRLFAGSAAVNGKIYVIGGVTLEGLPEPSVEEYDPTTNSWTDRAEFPGGSSFAPREAAVVAVGTKIYVLGGMRSLDGTNQPFTPTATVYVHDVGSDTWSSSPSMDLPVGPLGATHAAAVNNHIYLVGGEGIGTQLIDTIWDLDLSTESWTAREHLPTPRSRIGVAVRGGLIFLIGGYSPADLYAKTVDIYDPSRDSFSAGPELTHPRWYTGAATVGDRVYAVDGRVDDWDPGWYGNLDSLDTVEVLADIVEAPPCLPGKYLASPTDTACTMAPPGSFVGTVGATSATLCAPGSYSDWFGAIKCDLAPHGTYVNGEGATGVTTPTELGSYLSSVIGATLIPCAPGSYADTPGLFACIPAPRGTFVSATGATAPTPCPEGTGSRPGWARCAPLPAGTSLRFSGGQALQLNDVGTVRTVAAWVKRAQDGGGPIVSQWGPASGARLFTDSTFQFIVEVRTDGHVYASLRNWRGPTIATLASSSMIDPDTWTHVAAVFQDPRTVTIYINGAADNAVTLPFSFSTRFFPPVVSSARFLVGASDEPPPGGDQFFDGQVSDVKIWDSHDDGSGFLASYAASDCTTAWVHVPLTEGSGSTVSVTSSGYHPVEGWVEGWVTSELIGNPEWADDGPPANAFCGPDPTPPTISASDVTAIAADPAGAVVSFAPEASDDSGIVTVSCTPASPALLTIGSHDVSCTATDGAGNSASAAFTVTVLDGVPPTITAPAPAPVEATSSGGAIVTFSASATDNVPGPVTVSCSAASGALFAIGTTAVSCTATDAAGNISLPAIFNIVVRDTTPPTIDASAAVAVTATSAAGAVVTYPSPATHDIVDAAGMATCAPASGTTFPIGATTVTCTATDAHGNAAAPATFVVTVNDVTTPGSMHGQGKVRAGDDAYHFDFDVREQARGERGKFSLKVEYGKRPGLDKKGRPTTIKPEDARFRATAITFVAFSDDPTIRPGRTPRPQIDTVSFAGTGEWNGLGGYTFEVRAVDEGEPGRHRESIAIVIRDSSGQVVAQGSGVLASGNVQSTRLEH